MSKALRFLKAGAGILGFCLLSAQLPGIQPVPDEATYPFEPREYLQRPFPKTAAILY
jgi:hypothetical protein